jgi:16S rRNA (cytosine967-C5)-methyltransferase
VASQLTPSRKVALQVLQEVREGRFAEDALSDALDRQNLSAKDKNLTTELVYGVVRWRDRLDSIIRRCVLRPGTRVNPDVREILRTALYQIFFLQRIPEHAAVDQAVMYASQHSKKYAGFVNAVLRRALRDRETVDPPPGKDSKRLAVYYSHPEWLVRRWLHRFGYRKTKHILQHDNSRASLELRLNTLKATADTASQILEESELQAIPGFPNALRVMRSSGKVEAIRGFLEGSLVVQALASQMIAPLLKPEPDMRILDACAAPGGKTSHLAALVQDKARIVALDISQPRLNETAANLQRLGVRSVEFVVGDAADPHIVKDLGTFDRILVDAPCSNLGVLRHNPEAKYRVTPEALTQSAHIQSRILFNMSRLLNPRGILVYSVCSPTEEETVGVVDAFLSANTGFSLIPFIVEEVPMPTLVGARGFFATFPPLPEMPLDGFFAARVARN